MNGPGAGRQAGMRPCGQASLQLLGPSDLTLLYLLGLSFQQIHSQASCSSCLPSILNMKHGRVSS